MKNPIALITRVKASARCRPDAYEKAEYYELILDQERDPKGQLMYFVWEMHGWWSEERKEPIHNLKTLSPEEGYPSWDDAFGRYKQQRKFRAKGGFLHSFSPHYYGQRKYEYQLLEVCRWPSPARSNRSARHKVMGGGIFETLIERSVLDRHRRFVPRH